MKAGVLILVKFNTPKSFARISLYMLKGNMSGSRISLFNQNNLLIGEMLQQFLRDSEILIFREHIEKRKLANLYG